MTLHHVVLRRPALGTATNHREFGLCLVEGASRCLLLLVIFDLFARGVFSEVQVDQTLAHLVSVVLSFFESEMELFFFFTRKIVVFLQVGSGGLFGFGLKVSVEVILGLEIRRVFLGIHGSVFSWLRRCRLTCCTFVVGGLNISGEIWISSEEKLTESGERGMVQQSLRKRC